MDGRALHSTAFALVTEEGKVEVNERLVDLPFTYDELQLTSTISFRDGKENMRVLKARLHLQETHLFAFRTGENAGFHEADTAGFLELSEGRETSLSFSLGDHPRLTGTLSVADFALFTEQLYDWRAPLEGALLLSIRVYVDEAYPNERHVGAGDWQSVLVRQHAELKAEIAQIQFRHSFARAR